MNKSLLALATGSFALGFAEFVMMGILPATATGLRVSVPDAGDFISAYALGVCAGTLFLVFGRRVPPKRLLLGFVALVAVGNAAAACAPSAEALVEQTGCDGIMIGRGAEGNPWIFKQILHYRETGETLAKPTQHEVKEMMLRHARMQVEYKGGAIGIREMRKHVAWYTAGFPHSAKLRAAINQVESLQELEQMLNEWERG